MAGIAEDEIVEHTLTQIQECYLFNLPPRVRAQGWLAADMTKQMWTGRLRVVQRGMEAAVMLIDRRDGKLFAMCKVEDGAVERVPDSSRYFVIKIQNAQGRHAFVGLAFDDRNQAFDFNVALQEFKKDVERSKMLAKGAGEDGNAGGEDSSSAPSAASNLSLKQGEKIKISIGGGKPSSRPRRSGASGGGGGLLAPPPGDTARKSGSGGLLAPPPGDTRRARGVVPPSKPAEPEAPTAASASPAASVSSAAPSANSSFPSSSSSPTSSGMSAAAPTGAVVSSSYALSPDPFAGGGGIYSGGAGGSGGLEGGGMSGSIAPSGGAQTNSSNTDDDPLGLGLGVASLGTAAPPPAHMGGAGWGLSDLSGLGVGLPAVRQAGVAGDGARNGSPGLGQTTGGMAGGVSSQQQALAQDAFPQAGGSSSGGRSPTGAGASAPQAAAKLDDDPFGGLF